MASVWQRLTEIVGSASERTGVVGALVNLIDPDTWLPGGKDAAFTLALIALSAKMAVSDGVYLSDGPNDSKAARRARIERMLEEQGNDDQGFTLFCPRRGARV